MRRDLFICLLLSALTWAVYGQVVGHALIAFDDQTYITFDPAVRAGLSSASLHDAFGRFYFSNWHPLTTLSFMLDQSIWGDWAGGWHLTNVLLHNLAAVALYVWLRRATGGPWTAAWVAAMFALHPLHVESVAWVSERKDVLSGLFGLLTLVAYVAYVRHGGIGRYLLTLLCFTLGLLSKSMLVTWPFVLLLLDFWPLRRRWSPRLIIEKIPFFILSAASGVVTMLAQRADYAVNDVSMRGRILNALLAYGVYLRKTFWPTDLSVFYPLRPVGGRWMDALMIAAGLLVITAALWTMRRRRPAVLVGWLWFLGTLVPVIGLVQVGQQALADRYTYLPLIGLFIAMAWGLREVANKGRSGRLLLGITALGTVLACLPLTYRQVSYWRDTRTLFSHALRLDPTNYVAWYNHVVLAMADGQWATAVRLGELVVRHGGDDASTLANYSAALFHLGRRQEALYWYRRAARKVIQTGEVHATLAGVLAGCGWPEQAEAHYRQAIGKDASLYWAFYNYGLLLAQQNRLEEAIEQFRQALRVKPDYESPRLPLAMALEMTGRRHEAIAMYRQVPRSSAHPEAMIRLAWLLATDPDPAVRQPAEALVLARWACELTRQGDALALDALGAAAAAGDDFPLAIAATSRAEAIARTTGNVRLADAIAGRLTLYRAGRSFVAEVDTTRPAP